MGNQSEARQYKDSVFRFYFKDKSRLLSLYQALVHDFSHTADEIVITDLAGTLGSRVRNDISFRIGNQEVILLEHQSTLNANMPLRFFHYLAKLWWQSITQRDLLRDKLYKIPAPFFFVLYNGRKSLPNGHLVLKLSDAFVAPSDRLELIVEVFDIKHELGGKILKDCHALAEYSLLVYMTEEFKLQGCSLDEAFRRAVQYCIEHSVMKEFLESHKMEVFDMFSFEYDEDLVRDVAREEGREEAEISLMKRLMKNLSISESEAMRLLEIPPAKISAIAISPTP